MLELRVDTRAEWLDAVFADFDAFLIDHAACERKASATGMSFVVRYPDRAELVEPMIEFSREELEHFHIVYRILAARGLKLAPDYKDEYVNALLSQARRGGPELLLDRLIVAGVVEARGCERLRMLADALRDRQDPLSDVYLDLARAESRHHALFFRLARQLFAPDLVTERAQQLLDFEASLIERLPHRPAVH
ncbi:MAG TPA: tRNA-(ms[2]io[6]A)-hydroxylase [Polyangiaceae bacterium]|nr:tRNA-(ms[2]io[6]A)-hydroxylase [Polyangiaceae bacterium]